MLSSIDATQASQAYEMLITQIMQVERQPQDRLQDSLASLQKRKSILSDFDSNLSAFDALLEKFTDPLQSLFESKSANLNSEAIAVTASDDAQMGAHTAQVLQLASNDTRVTQQYDSTGSTLKTFFDTNGSQTFSVEVASPSTADPDNRELISITVNPAGTTNEEILGEISSAINSAMTSAYNANTIGQDEKAIASVVNEYADKSRLALRSGQTGYVNRLTFLDSVDGMLSFLEISDNVVVGATGTPATSAYIAGNDISGPVVIDGTNNTLNIDVNEATVNATLTTATYNTLAELATEVEAQIGANVTVSVDGSALLIETVATGSETSLENLSGSLALNVLGLGEEPNPASVTGDDLPGTIIIGLSNRNLDIDVNGITINATLSLGTYSIASLATEVGAQIGADVAVTVDGSALKIETVATGSSASINNLGGSALSTLGLDGGGTSASVTGTSITAPIEIEGSSDKVELSIDGIDYSEKLTRQTYNTLADLATEIESAFGSDKITVTVVGDTLKIETVSTGTGASIQVLDGDDLSVLGLSEMGSPNTGAGMATVIGTDGNGLQGTDGTDAVTSNSSTAGGMITDVGTSESDSKLNSALTLNGLTVYRDSNLVTDALEGVRFNLNAVSTGAEEFSITSNAEAVATEIETFIDNYNNLLGFIKDESAFGSSGASGNFAHDLEKRQLRFNLRTDLVSQVTGLTETGPSRITDLGIQIQTDGTLKLIDEDALIQAVEDDAEAVSDFFSGSDGIATRFQNRIESFIGTGGTIDQLDDQLDARIKNKNAQISNFDGRMSRRESHLREEFARLQQAIALFEGQQYGISGLLG